MGGRLTSSEVLEAFWKWKRPYLAAIRSVFYGKDDPEDIFHDIMAYYAPRIAEWHDPAQSTLASYLYGQRYHLACHWYRHLYGVKNLKTPRPRFRCFSDLEDPEEERRMEDTLAMPETPQSGLEVDALAYHIRRLHPSDKRVVYPRLHGFTYAEIASRESISRQRVEQLLKRAKKRLREKMTYHLDIQSEGEFEKMKTEIEALEVQDLQEAVEKTPSRRYTRRGKAFRQDSPEDTQEEAIRQACDFLKETLTKKHRNYGGSAFEPPLLCPECKDAAALIRARASDKIARLRTLLAGSPDEVGESVADTVLDLAGYLILWLVAMKREQ